MTETSLGEAVTFWILAPVAVLAAIGMVVSRKAVHSAIQLAVVMISLAVFFGLQEAPFLAVVQVVVYTGAVLMLFLFVLMLIGVETSESLVETIRGQRIAAVIAALGFAALVLGGVGNAAVGVFNGLGPQNKTGNVPALAEIIFTRYVFAFEVTGALLITAALGAMVLAHRERTEPRRTQRELAVERFLGAAGPVTMLPPPGTYARHNSIGTPALLPDGSIAEASIPGPLRARGDVLPASEIPAIAHEPADEREATEGSQLGKGATP